MGRITQPKTMSKPAESKLVTLLRGATGSCPACGFRRIFKTGMRLQLKCPSCEISFDRSPGHWVGAVGINTIISMFALLVTIVLSTLLLWPDLKVLPMLLPALIVGFVSPVVFYPISQTLWTAIDLILLEDK